MNVLSQLWYKYFPFWPLFLLLIAFGIADAWIYLKLKNPVYEASATVLIKDERKGLDDSRIMESINNLSAKKIVENEIEVIRSKTLIEQAINELYLYAPLFQKKEYTAVPAYSTAPVQVIAQHPEDISPVKEVPIRFNREDSSVLVGTKQFRTSEWVNTPYGVLKFVPVWANSRNSGTFYFSLINTQQVTEQLLMGLDIKPVSKLSSVVSLTLRDESRKRAEDILNHLIKAYTDASIVDKTELARNTLKFIDERLGNVSTDLDTIDRKLEVYKSTQGAVDLSSQGKLFLDNVGQVDQQLNEVNIQMSILGQVEKYVSDKDGAGGIVPATLGVKDPILTSLLDKLYEQELEYQKLSKTTSRNSPFLLGVTDQINKIKPSILENVKNQKNALLASKQKLLAANSSYAAVLEKLPKKEKDLLEISRDRNIKSSIHDYLLQKREETALSSISISPDSRVVDKARATYLPVSPRVMVVYAISILGCLVFGLFLVAASEWLKKTVLFRAEIEAATDAPVIGEITLEKSKSSLVIGDGERSFIAEQFRLIRTSLSRIGISKDHKCLVVTSSISGEGKSFIVANLGVTLALTGKKVVLLELDLSSPSLCHKLDFHPTGYGLSDYLTGIAEPEEIIKRTTVNQNLFIMAAGRLPSNPSELIVSDRLGTLISYLNAIFDYVIIDSAPVGLLSDAYVISNYCDATLFIIRHGYTPKIALKRLDANNQINELKNMAIIFNGVRARGFFKNGYGYGYGYGYVNKSPLKRKTLQQQHN